MKPQNTHLRTDQKTGDVWITHEQLGRPIIRFKNITNDIFLALAADLIADSNTEPLVKDIKFNDGMIIRLTTELIAVSDGA